YLSKYPYEKSIFSKGIYVTIFILAFIILEFISVKMGAITYHHGWNLWWSLFFVTVMFAIIRLHFTRPLMAIILSIPFALLLCMIFNVTLDKMK
ncbi:MAG: hypothetical protein ACO1OT_12335, partial [Heyndrickxia sp.]